MKQNNFAFPLVGFWYFPSNCLTFGHCIKDLPWVFTLSCELFSSQAIIIPTNPHFQAHPSLTGTNSIIHSSGQYTSAKLSPALSHTPHIWCQKYHQAWPSKTQMSPRKATCTARPVIHRSSTCPPPSTKSKPTDSKPRGPSRPTVPFLVQSHPKAQVRHAIYKLQNLWLTRAFPCF